ncbi:MAG: methionyl-tRNA formyltransferase [Planctomycetia bacterium]|nr:methionyl-tRNA formyltransferase [Planctomycetia bacterium]
MRVVFAGTPEFAVPVLRAVAGAGHAVPLVLSQPDRPKGRGRVLEATPVKAAALALGLAVEQPERIGDAAEAIRGAAPDVIVTAAYGQKVPGRVLRLARHGGLNVHASLLPRHRGAAPVAYAILAGDVESGVTIFRMVNEMDAGPVLVRAAFPVRAGETTPELEGRIAEAAGPALLEALRRLEAGTAFEEQDHARATVAPKLTRADGVLDFARPAAELERRVRAMTPWPGTWAVLERPGAAPMRVAVLAAAAAAGEFPGAPGDIVELRKGAVRVRCGTGALDLLRVQPESRKPVTADEFANGFRLREAAGARFAPDDPGRGL